MNGQALPLAFALALALTLVVGCGAGVHYDGGSTGAGVGSRGAGAGHGPGVSGPRGLPVTLPADPVPGARTWPPLTAGQTKASLLPPSWDQFATDSGALDRLAVSLTDLGPWHFGVEGQGEEVPVGEGWGVGKLQWNVAPSTPRNTGSSPEAVHVSASPAPSLGSQVPLPRDHPRHPHPLHTPRGLQTPVVTISVDPTGVNSPTCGAPAATPCATIVYAVGVAGASVPATSPLHIAVAAGSYGPDSCGALGLRPLTITGAGSGSTVVDCGGRARLVLALASLSVSGLTVTRGFAPVLGRSAGGVALDGGGAIAVMWSGTGPPGSSTASFSDLVFVNSSVNGATAWSGASLGLVAGGALLVVGVDRVGGATVDVQDCTFVGNAVNVTDLNYTSVSLNQAQSKIDKGSFGGGMAVLILGPVVSGAHVSVKNVSGRDNVAGSMGGAVFTALYGIRGIAHSTLYAENVDATNNYVGGSGGGIMQLGAVFGPGNIVDTNITAYNLSVTGNVAATGSDGGAHQSLNLAVGGLIANCTIYALGLTANGNRAYAFNGGIHQFAQTDIVRAVDGAVDGLVITAERVVARDNVAETLGGGGLLQSVYCHGNGNVTYAVITAKDITATGNIAGNNGGGFYQLMGTGNLGTGSGSTLHSSVSATSVYAVNNSAGTVARGLGEGGGFYQRISVDGTGITHDCLIFAADVIAINNSAVADGGGFHQRVGPSPSDPRADEHDASSPMTSTLVRAQNVTVHNNSAGGSGSGFYQIMSKYGDHPLSNSSVEADLVSVVGNNADKSGGGFFPVHGQYIGHQGVHRRGELHRHRVQSVCCGQCRQGRWGWGVPIHPQ